MSAAERADRTREADEVCRAAFESAVAGTGQPPGPGGGPYGLALVAVGGFGRGELAPHSDLDVVLVHDGVVPERVVAAVSEQVWYPLWDTGRALDHAVRALPEATEAARADPRVAVGLLDARHLAGDPSLTLRLRAELLAHWRRDARDQLPRLRELADRRAERMGELAHATVPDLKESLGGLRDATLLKALVATWLVDVAHTDLERARTQLLDVRDQLHVLTGRGSDRVPAELWPELAERWADHGVGTAAEAQREVREIGRRITHLSRLTWRRVDAVLARPRNGARRSPGLEPVAPGVAVSAGEVVLDRRADPAADPALLLRAAAEAAERGLALNPATAARLARSAARPAEPWDPVVRQLFTRLLGAGAGLLPVWETLDETGALAHILPEWERVRLLPHASEVHRFTVDRHLVETCIEASRLVRRVRRPDLLVLAALLHDIGKGGVRDHSVVGEPVAVAVAARLGFDESESALVGRLVRWHLLLAQVAITRDLEDPATATRVADRVGDEQALDLLAALTEADARATSAKAWTPWRAALVAELVNRVRACLAAAGRADQRGAGPGTPVAPVDAVLPDEGRVDPTRAVVRVVPSAHGSTVSVVCGDRVGVIADTAAALAVLRLTVRSARAWTQEDVAVSVWEVAEERVDEAMVRQRVDAVLSGRLDAAARLRRTARAALEPVVLVRHGASEDATVLEVRVDDRPGVVHDVCRALATLGVSVRSAHVDTLGPQAVDVFYVVEPGAAALADDRAAAAAHVVREALSVDGYP